MPGLFVVCDFHLMNPPLFDDKNSPTFDNITITVTERSLEYVRPMTVSKLLSVMDASEESESIVSVSTVSIVIKLDIPCISFSRLELNWLRISTCSAIPAAS